MTDTSQPKSAATPEVIERVDAVADPANPEIVADAPTPEPVAGAPKDPAPPLPGREARMKEIADKLKAKRASENAPDTTLDYSDPTQAYGNIGKPPVAEPSAADAAADQVKADMAADAAAAEKKANEPADAPRKFKVKVRHEDRELTEDEMIAAAQKGLAGDSYLDEARRIRDQADEVLKAARAPASRPHPGDPSARTDDEPVPEPSADDPHQEAAKLVEDIQLGDPKEAAAKLVAFIKKQTTTGSQAAVMEQRLRDDWAITQSEFSKFQADNRDIVADKRAAAVIKDAIFDGYREDLIALGAPADSLPTDINLLADAHRVARVSGQKVRSTEKLLEDAKAGFQQWRGTTPSPTPTPSPAPRESQPRVVVDRTERRQAIPTQPTRSTAPPQQVPNAGPQKRTRSMTIEQMKKARGQISAVS